MISAGPPRRRADPGVGRSSPGRKRPLGGLIDLATLAVVLLVLASSVLHPGRAAHGQSERRDCQNTSTGLVPLTDLGAGSYQGVQGGLYPGSANQPPQSHLEHGVRLASLVQPLDDQGRPDGDGGAIALLAVGVSNTRVEFDAFSKTARDDPTTNPELVFVNGAQTGVPLGPWSDPSSRAWSGVDAEISGAGVSPLQVQVAWIKLPAVERGEDPFPRGPMRYADLLTEVVRNLKERFPNVHLAYLSSRIYGGYTPGGEPVAYQNGFGVRFTIERQLTGQDLDFDLGSVTAPWIGWGPYLWADGMSPRGDGLVWECDDFRPDGLHPGDTARQKVGQLLLDHLQSDPTARSWFLAPEFRTAPPPTSAGTSTTLTPSAPLTPPTSAATTSTHPSSTPSSTPTTVSAVAPTPDGSVPWVVVIGALLAIGVAVAIGWWRNGRRGGRL